MALVADRSAASPREEIKQKEKEPRESEEEEVLLTEPPERKQILTLLFH